MTASPADSAFPVRSVAEIPFGRAAGRSRTRRRVRSGVWVYGFVLFQIACQLMLLLDALSPARVLLRSAAFGASLVLLLWIPKRFKPHPSASSARFALGLIALAIFNPYGNTIVAVVAHAALYFAILGPVFWVPRLALDLRSFERLLVILWIFHVASASTGVLQVLYPGQFQPALSLALQGSSEGYLSSLQITTASGARVFRPMGLTDSPGGAGVSGLYAVLFSMGFLLLSRRGSVKAICIAGMSVGVVCLYLSQVRATMITTAITALAFCIVMALRGRVRELGILTAVLAFVLPIGLAGAIAVGGHGVTSRLQTLTDSPPIDVYYESRGRFLEHTLQELLPRYPFGAGLGRWGMMNGYFGSNTDPARGGIWVEIQWTGWLLDGGVPLIVAYFAALVIAGLFAWRIARRATGDVWIWGALVLAYNMGALALTFSYPLFIGQSGLELWLLNGALFAAWRDSVTRQRRSPI